MVNVCAASKLSSSREYSECQAFCPVVPIGSPQPQPSVAPPLGSTGETHSLAKEGVVGPNSDEGTDTLVLYVYYNPSTLRVSRKYAVFT